MSGDQEFNFLIDNIWLEKKVVEGKAVFVLCRHIFHRFVASFYSDIDM